jgi:hypothetical protein
MASFATPAFEHDFVFKELTFDRRYPTQELLCVLVVGLSKPLPLPAESGRSGRFLCFNFVK